MEPRPTSSSDISVAGIALDGSPSDDADAIPLFRPEVFTAQEDQWMSKPTLAIPASFAIYSATAMCMIAALFAILTLCSYAPSETVKSVILPLGGIRRIEPGKSGIVVKKYVDAGHAVRAGMPIMAISALDTPSDQSASVKSLPNTTETSRTVTDAQMKELAVLEMIRADEVSAGLSPESNSTTTDQSAMDIVSPIDGVVYHYRKNVGDNFYEFEHVATVASSGALCATVYVSPVTHVQTRKDMVVEIELDAFKNQKKAKLRGKVVAISTGPIESGEMRSEARPAGPLYEVKIMIIQESAVIDKKFLLGKSVMVRMPTQKRKLYEWLLDPLRSLF